MFGGSGTEEWYPGHLIGMLPTTSQTVLDWRTAERLALDLVKGLGNGGVTSAPLRLTTFVKNDLIKSPLRKEDFKC